MFENQVKKGSSLNFKLPLLEMFLPYGLRFRSKNKRLKVVSRKGRKPFKFNKFKKRKPFFNNSQQNVVSFNGLLSLKKSKINTLRSANKNLLRSSAKRSLLNTVGNFNFFRFQGMSLSAVNLTKSVHMGGLFRGFPLLLKQVGLRVFINTFLRPRWYRMCKLAMFKKFIFACYDNKVFMRGFMNNDELTFGFKKKKNFSFFFQFFLSKRWFLDQILKKNAWFSKR